MVSRQVDPRRGNQVAPAEAPSPLSHSCLPEPFALSPPPPVAAPPRGALALGPPPARAPGPAPASARPARRDAATGGEHGAGGAVGGQKAAEEVEGDAALDRAARAGTACDQADKRDLNGKICSTWSRCRRRCKTRGANGAQRASRARKRNTAFASAPRTFDPWQRTRNTETHPADGCHQRAARRGPVSRMPTPAPRGGASRGARETSPHAAGRPPLCIRAV